MYSFRPSRAGAKTRLGCRKCTADTLDRQEALRLPGKVGRGKPRIAWGVRTLCWPGGSQARHTPPREDCSSQAGGAVQGWVSLFSFPGGSWPVQGVSSEPLIWSGPQAGPSPGLLAPSVMAPEGRSKPGLPTAVAQEPEPGLSVLWPLLPPRRADWAVGPLESGPRLR